MLYYSENVTGSIGRVNLELGETGDLIMKGVGEVQGKSSLINIIIYCLHHNYSMKYIFGIHLIKVNILYICSSFYLHQLVKYIG